jgi:SAM-dependent methyltransferase
MTDEGKDLIAGQVRTLYDEYPYPAHGVVSSVIPSMIRESLERLFRELGRRDLRVLDAGCGTGEQTLGLARAFPTLEVVGVDITRVSLEFARKLAERHRIAAAFERADLSRPLDPSLGTFDVIVSIGVLHHLPDTVAGFRHVRAMARPHALFMGMVYGKFGRSDFYVVREALRMISGEGEAARTTQIEIIRENALARNARVSHYADELSRRLRFGPRINPYEALRRVLAGRSAQYQADGYTHVKDTAYTWDELIDLLSETGWAFTGWPRKSGMPDAPEQLFRGRALDLVRRLDQRRQAAIYERLVMPGNLYFLAKPRGGS